MFSIAVCHTVTISKAKVQTRYESSYQLQYGNNETGKQLYKADTQFDTYYMYYCDESSTYGWQLDPDKLCSTSGDIEAPQVS